MDRNLDDQIPLKAQKEDSSRRDRAQLVLDYCLSTCGSRPPKGPIADILTSDIYNP